MFNFGKKKVDINPEKIEEILDRSVSNVLPTKEELKKKLLSGERLRIYAGADATGPQLHLGHSTNFIILEKLRKLGHEIIILFGDFTAKIGDPSGKDSTRKALSQKEVDKNLKNWKEQVSKIVDLGNRDNPVKIVFNGDWLAKLKFQDIINLSSNFTVQQMIERDMFQKRIQESKPIYMHEFFYPLMQGYDSVVLDVDLEIGGNDQTFNMMAGRTLMQKLKNKNKFVMATTLLVNPVNGKKLMSKSEGSFVALNDKPQEMFGKIMALPDEVIIPMFKDTTFVDLEKISQIDKAMRENRLNPRDAKKQLAREIVTIYHSKSDAKDAEENFEKAFGRGEVPNNLEEVFVEKGRMMVDVLLEQKIISSKNEWRRLIEQKGATILENSVDQNDEDKKITDQNFIINEEATFRIGKKRFLKIKIK